ncbi:MAG: hypothetical protein KC618_07170, partial [Candidatus Omnitrophica bacterium]|nr:hypothetical protein [Candidatus Omnitrophota bacterium]
MIKRKFFNIFHRPFFTVWAAMILMCLGLLLNSSHVFADTCQERDLLNAKECKKQCENGCNLIASTDGDYCYECKKPLDHECAKRFPGTMPEHLCDIECNSQPGKFCVSKGTYPNPSGRGELVCYECVEKPQECKDIGLLDNNACRKCLSNPEMTCIEAGKTNWGENCYQCISKADYQCAISFPGMSSKEACEKNCRANDKECLPNGVENIPGEKKPLVCYECVDRAETCRDLNLLSRDDCENCWDNPASECVPAVVTGSGEQCFKCQLRGDYECARRFPGTVSNNTCINTCTDANKECVVSVYEYDDGRSPLECATCEDKPQECFDIDLLDKVQCPSCEADPNKECKIAGQTKEGKLCYSCEERPQVCG